MAAGCLNSVMQDMKANKKQIRQSLPKTALPRVYQIDIEYDAFNRGYYYTKKTFRLPAGFTTAEDLLALNMAKNIFSL